MNSVTVPPIDFASLPRAELADDGGRKLDAILCVTADVAHAVAEAVRQGYAVMPAGGLTSAINSFDYSKDALGAVSSGGFKDVVAIRAKSAVAAEVVADDTPLEQLKTNQVAIRKDKGLVAAGAGLTFEQVNAALAEHVGPTARVLIDLTSVASAWVGGVIATGGMGPLRTRPSNILDAVCLADGGDPRLVEGYENILGVEGMQGWTGMVAAAQFRYFLVPSSEFGLVLPVQGSDVDAIAGLMAYLEPWTRVALPEAGGRLAAGDGGETVLNGIELVSRDSLVAFVEHAGEPARTKAQGLLQSCEYANADMLACLTGWSEQSVDDVLMSLLDPETETIGGIMIDYGVGFSSGAEMDTFRAIREGAPDLARTRARVTPPGKLKPYSTSTDINVVTPADSSVIADILTAYADYRAAIRGLAAELDGTVEVEIWAYGHLSTNGIDPHHRVILFANQGEEGALAGAKQAVAAHKRALIRDILRAAERGGALVNGGEKGVPSLVEIARAAGGEARLPDDLKQRLGRARAAVAAAPAAFTFRVPAELK